MWAWLWQGAVDLVEDTEAGGYIMYLYFTGQLGG